MTGRPSSKTDNSGAERLVTGRPVESVATIVSRTSLTDLWIVLTESPAKPVATKPAPNTT